MRNKDLPKKLGGGTKKVLWTFFARALNPKKRGRNQDCVHRFLSLGAVVDWNYSYLRYLYFLINWAGAGLRNRDCVHRFLSLGAVVDWNYSYLRYLYFLINCAGAGLRNRDCVYRFLSCSLYCPISVAEYWDAGAVFSDAVDIHLT
ncbi:hypothetical protein D8785_05325 [Streptococcus australis]|nr:hypothetical protein D8785_05325 [Streptococcus australis]